MTSSADVACNHCFALEGKRITKNKRKATMSQHLGASGFRRFFGPLTIHIDWSRVTMPCWGRSIPISRESKPAKTCPYAVQKQGPTLVQWGRRAPCIFPHLVLTSVAHRWSRGKLCNWRNASIPTQFLRQTVRGVTGKQQKITGGMVYSVHVGLECRETTAYNQVEKRN
jgi:hypothetical protein